MRVRMDTSLPPPIAAPFGRDWAESRQPLLPPSTTVLSIELQIIEIGCFTVSVLFLLRDFIENGNLKIRSQ